MAGAVLLAEASKISTQSRKDAKALSVSWSCGVGY